MTKSKEEAQGAKEEGKTVKDTSKTKKALQKAKATAKTERPQNKNLEKGKATRFKSGEEAAKAGRKGGKKSGEKRRELKNMREWARMVLDMPVNEGDVVEEATSFTDLTGANTTVRGRIIKNLATKASNGDLHAIGMLSELAGEAPVQQVRVEVHDTTKMSVKELIAYREKLKQEEDASN